MRDSAGFSEGADVIWNPKHRHVSNTDRRFVLMQHPNPVGPPPTKEQLLEFIEVDDYGHFHMSGPASTVWHHSTTFQALIHWPPARKYDQPSHTGWSVVRLLLVYAGRLKADATPQHPLTMNECGATECVNPDHWAVYEVGGPELPPPTSPAIVQNKSGAWELHIGGRRMSKYTDKILRARIDTSPIVHVVRTYIVGNDDLREWFEGDHNVFKTMCGLSPNPGEIDVVTDKSIDVDCEGCRPKR